MAYKICLHWSYLSALGVPTQQYCFRRRNVAIGSLECLLTCYRAEDCLKMYENEAKVISTE